MKVFWTTVLFLALVLVASEFWHRKEPRPLTIEEQSVTAFHAAMRGREKVWLNKGSGR